jgi:hypothetical protein
MSSRSNRALQLTAVLAVGILIGVSLWAVPSLFPPPKSLDQQYQDAIDEATLGEWRSSFSGLIPIQANNSYLHWQDGKVLVLTFTRYPGSYPVNGTVTTYWGETWVTAVPQLKDVWANLTKPENDTIRVAQLLGMDWNTKNSYMAEFWVDPDDLFRPAADNEINDTSAYLNSTITDPVYKAWFQNEISSAYFQYPKANGFPWTRLGFTFDWGSSSHIGLSEFIVKRNSTILVNSVQTLEQYLAS